MTTAFSVGDQAPACFGVDQGRVFYSFEEQYGRPVVLLLAGTEAVSGLHGVICAISSSRDRFAERGADVLLVVDDDPSSFGAAPVLRTLDGGDFLGRCGVGPRDSMLLVLGRDLRVAMRSAVAANCVAACLGCLDDLPREAPRTVSQPAPAIVLPNLISPELCRDLMQRFETSPTIDGEVARVDAAGNVRSVVDHAKKFRRDMPIAADGELHRELRDTLLFRCVPQIAKAFQARVSHIDRLLVSRYDAGAGWFRRHRDNTAANVAFREFALSVNLNTGDYVGGDLLFPEYNDHLHCPPRGGGLIFSTSVLHEAAPVTSGRRYVLLTFFHGDAAEARRQVYFGRDTVSTRPNP